MPRKRMFHRFGSWLIVSVGLCISLLIVGCEAGPNETTARRRIDQPPTDYRSQIRRHFGDRRMGYGLQYGSDYKFSDPVKAAYRPAGETNWQYGYAVTAVVRRPVRQTGQIRRRPHLFFFESQSGPMHEVSEEDELTKLNLE